MKWGLFARVTTWFIINLVTLMALITVHFATNVTSLKWWPDAFSVAINLLAGGLVSFLFYFLVVHVPDRRKKEIVKRNLQKLYRGIKQDILTSVVLASIQGGRKDLSADSETLERLMEPEGFKEVFSNGREADEGFYAFQNQMSDETWEFRQIVLNLQMLSRQIEYLLHNYSISDQEAFDFFKRLELLLMRIQFNGAGYDESKRLCTFIWEIYAGWNWLDGNTGHDKIQQMINGL